MKSLNEILTILSEHKSSLKKKYYIKTLGIFGSYSHGDFDINSDIDILVEFEKTVGFEFIDLADELDNLLNNKVDLVSKKAIKPRYFNLIDSDLIYV